MSAARSPAPAVLPFDPAIRESTQHKHIKFWRSIVSGDPAPDDELHWFETTDVIEVGAGLVVPVQRFLQSRPPRGRDARYLRHLDAYLAIRLGQPRAV